MRNVNQAGRREVEEHRRNVAGVTASLPSYKVVDLAGHKEWVIDVYLGPLELVEKNILRDVPIAPYARHLVGGIRIPVELQRSKQGRYTVVGRSKEMPAGAQPPDGSILEPTFQEIKVNLADLGLLWIPDLDWTVEPWGEKIWSDEPWQKISATDAFGNPVVGEDAEPEIELYQPGALRTTKTRHVVLGLKTWGPLGHPDALRWGIDPWGAPLQKTVEHEE
jgi:hypothetical protein